MQLRKLSFSPIQRDRVSLVSPVGAFGSLWPGSLRDMFVETPQVDLLLECVCVVHYSIYSISSYYTV